MVTYKSRIFISLFVLIIIVASTSFLPTKTSAAGPWYVKPGGNDTSDCLSPGTACETINGALGKASSGDTINVAAGTYNGSGTEVVRITKHITLSGGWNSDFSAISGFSTIDGENTRRGLRIDGGNTATVESFIIEYGSGDGGPGVFADGSLWMHECIVRNNTDTGDWTSEGGGIRSANTLVIENSLIHDNTSSSGAGIFNAWGTVHLYNTTISGNIASGHGGGINNLGGTITTNNVTITNNADDGGGGGIHNEAGGTVTLENSILAGNTSGWANDCGGTIGTLGYNLIGDDTNCTFTPTTGDITNDNPELDSLADNGGPTLTHALIFGSPAVDNGNDSTCESTDQRGISRPVGAHCDIGAFEGSVTPDEDNPGFYKPSGLKWYLKNDQVSGWTNYTSFKFGGDPSWIAVAGDWNNNGVDSVGFYLPSTGKWYLKNTHTNGWNNYVSVKFKGASGAIPVTGDWDNDGQDTIGFYVPSGKKWYLKDNLADGWGAVTPVKFGGDSDWQPVTGDWDDDGQDTIGFYLPATGKWYLKNNLVDGWSDYVPVKFKGVSGAKAVSGDWNGSGGDTIGFYVQSGKKWYFKNNLVDGWGSVSNMKWGGDTDWQPVTGDWQ